MHYLLMIIKIMMIIETMMIIEITMNIGMMMMKQLTLSINDYFIYFFFL